ncbi:hypothetical protein ACUNV4_18635 [Granulosicoccus sp. 3-233]|uniref:hypothetical protein n=1 Tax=Granulosicoccus sp. 3-233 TaxID=3417969 RepID=UPI003D324B66
MHYRSAKALTLMLCGTVAGAASADPNHTYLEEDGVVVFEVEDAEPVDGWVLKTDLEGHLGTGYFEWSGPNSFASSSAGKGNITYHFRIQTAGNYEIRWRSQIAEGDSNTEANDSWMRLATGQDVPEEEALDGWTKAFTNTLGRWAWATRTVDHVSVPIRQYFSEGDHTMEISGRSIGHAIDRVVLYRYDDVNFSESAGNRWKPSSVVQGDGTVVDPDEVGGPEEPEPEPETPDPEPEPEVPVVRENLFVADPSWMENESNQCVDNRLALPASAVVSVDPTDSGSDYTAGEYLSVNDSDSSILMKFDLSLVPQASSAVIEYTTGDQASNGSIHHALGSHADWQEGAGEEGQQPEIMVALSQASGGWNAETRHQSVIPADLLTADEITVIISSDAESDPLQVYAEVASELAPRLMLSGNESFCSNWQANIDAQNAPEEPPVVEEETPEVTPEPEPEVEPEAEAKPDVESEGGSTSKSGALSWLLLLALSAVFAGKARLNRLRAG